VANIVERPIFIIGTGRCGTTLMFNLLHVHPELGWPSQHMVQRFYDRYDRWQGRLSRLPIIGRFAQHRKRHRSFHEPYDLWRQFDPGFNRPCRDLRAEDVTSTTRNGMLSAVEEQLIDMDKKRFITKYTGWSRIQYVDNIFPDALYLHVIRDGRAVAASLLTQSWWHGWQGPNQWRWGALSPEHKTIWQSSEQSFFVLAGLQWKILMENIREAGMTIGNRYREVRYEDIIANPESVFSSLLEWGDLVSDPFFLSHIRNAVYHNANEKWRTQIHQSEIERFETLLAPALAMFGYAE